jgi:hypothetical protein
MRKAKSKTTAADSHRKGGKKWVQNVNSVSTFPPKELFTRELEKAKHLLQQKATVAKPKSRANSPG